MTASEWLRLALALFNMAGILVTLGFMIAAERHRLRSREIARKHMDALALSHCYLLESVNWHLRGEREAAVRAFENADHAFHQGFEVTTLPFQASKRPLASKDLLRWLGLHD